MFGYIFSIIILLFCVAFIAIGVSFVHKINDLTKKCTLKTTCEIIDYSREQKYDNSTEYRHRHVYYVYTPIVKCYIAGSEIVKKLNTGHISPNVEEQETGKEIEVFFNPYNYDEFYTIEDKGLKTIGIFIICIGVFAILFILISFVIPLLFGDIWMRMFFEI